jgi:hypothetical protein
MAQILVRLGEARRGVDHRAKRSFGFLGAFHLDEQRAEERAHVHVLRITLECRPASRLGRGKIAGIDQADGLVEDRLGCKRGLHRARQGPARSGWSRSASRRMSAA